MILFIQIKLKSITNEEDNHKMIPSKENLKFLQTNKYIRNTPLNNFLINNNYEIIISNYILYCCGTISNIRLINALRIKEATNTTDIVAYHIEWFNTSLYDNYDENIEFEKTTFWVHSGAALRKNFFIYEDKMSFLKSTFLFDQQTSSFYRLYNIYEFIKFNFISNQVITIYTSPHKKIIKSIHEIRNEKLTILYKKRIFLKEFQKLINTHNNLNFIEKNFNQLFNLIKELNEENNIK